MWATHANVPDRNLVVVRAVGGFFDAGVSLLISDLDTDDRVHVDSRQLSSLNHRHRHLSVQSTDHTQTVQTETNVV